MDAIHYLINFLSGDSDKDYSKIVGYTSNPELFSAYKIVIIPCGFFDAERYGKKESLPSLPLATIENIPLLFGTPKIEKQGATLVIHADIIASTYFLISRYEEWILKDLRDEHGRFPGKESLPYKAGFINRPIVDEYARLLQKCLVDCGVDIKVPQAGFQKIYLTHDVDHVTQYHTKKGLAAAIYRSLTKGTKEIKTALTSFFSDLDKDPLYTFPWLLEEDKKLKDALHFEKVEIIFFFKSLLELAEADRPNYNLLSDDLQELFRLCDRNMVHTGLHTSYYSADNPDYIALEKENLEIACGSPVFYNRRHYLRTKSPEDMINFLQVGITNDFSMGYPDIAGFRLGTCKAVQWIDLKTKSASTLTLHPLSVMDITLKDERYMNLSYPEALKYAKNIIDTIKAFNGELVFLWHNSNLNDEDIFSQKKLYAELLTYISKVAND